MPYTKEFELLMRTIEGLKKKMKEQVTERLLEDEAMLMAKELSGFATKFRDAAKKLKQTRQETISSFIKESKGS